LGIVRVVMFAPEDLEIIKGDPAARRQFLDDIMIQRSPRMAGVKADYERVVKQRNALLKQASQAPRKRGSAAREPDPYLESTLQVWDEQLCSLGAAITATRFSLVNELQPHVARRYSEVASGGSASSDVTLRYLAKCLSLESDSDANVIMQNEDFWREQLSSEVVRRRSDEIQRGISLAGPHRDELLVNLGPHPVKGYASHGETWSTVLALRLASADVLRSDGVDPILILDDVFAELDTKRRERLALMALEATQTLITAAVAEDIPATLDGARFSVRRGEVTGEAA
jgi:DNA replication and repair protein RecF